MGLLRKFLKAISPNIVFLCGLLIFLLLMFICLCIVLPGPTVLTVFSWLFGILIPLLLIIETFRGIRLCLAGDFNESFLDECMCVGTATLKHSIIRYSPFRRHF